MSSTPTIGRLKCALYLRISKDKKGLSLGVDRQEEACRALAAQLGWEVYAAFSENDLSAYSGKPRPLYNQLLDVMRSGQVSAVIALHTDRLHRSPVELEEFIDICEQNRVEVRTVQAGELDLTTATGRMAARIYGAVARHEVEHAIERVKAAKLQAAKAGKTSGGNRAYGYRPGGMVIDENEAQFVLEAIDRFIAGDSWRTIALDFNRRCITTAKGNMWKAINVRNMATLPRHAGYREHHGVLYEATWPPIITRDTYEQLQSTAKRRQEQDKRRSYAKKHLLTGFVFCGLCGNRMTIINAQNRDGSYSPAFSCRKIDQFGNPTGCGKVKRRKDPVEHLVIESLLYRLDTPDLGALLGQSEHDDGELRTKLGEHATQSARLQEILDAYASGDLTMSEWKTAKATAQARLDQLDKDIAKLTSRRTIAHLPAGLTVRQAWEAGDLEWRRQLLDVLIERVLIYPREKGDQKVRYAGFIFNPERVEIRWRA
ncbi:MULTISPECIES: recombinase family protein [Arthrobacter]|uniref:recombinase family protein n=1 Tax=Arthrobacter TaxID=1663 RepID=UPI00197AF02C|nr:MULTISPECIES: recombinase family protein [Arthrobacter]